MTIRPNSMIWRSVQFFALALLIHAGSAAGQLHRQIDSLITAKAGGAVSERSSDAEFFRRVNLDFAGVIPTAAEVQAFLKDQTANKRTKLIDRLLASDAFAAHWTDRLSVMLLERQKQSWW